MRRAPREPSLAVGHGDQRRRLASAQAIPGRRAATALQRTAAAGTLDLAGTKAASSFTHTCPVQRRLEDAARAAAALPATQASRRRCAVGRVVFPPLLSASADGARSPDDHLHSAIVQLLKRRQSRPKHERLSAPPRQPLPGQPPGGDLRRGLRACRRGSHRHELAYVSNIYTVHTSNRVEIPCRARPPLADGRTPSGRTPTASPPVAAARPWRRRASASLHGAAAAAVDELPHLPSFPPPSRASVCCELLNG